ncbi:MAG: histidinol phosphate aminotransferase [Pelagimonas sp.]|uniref:histidinol phosphate aminotransferase n=1 Tax=Pelagimonas sp. TaxID=2073170 RepID=UPI003D6ACBE5
MHDSDPQTPVSYRTANLILVFVNLFWVFLVVWSTWGISAVLILGAVLNHLITRYEIGLRRRAADRHAADRDDDRDDDQGHDDDDPSQPQN